MKNKLMLVVGGLIVVGIAGFLVWNRGQVTPTSSTASDETNMQSDTGAQSMNDLLASGRSQKCEFTDSTDSGTTQGVMYLSGKMRGDFTSVQGSETTVMHMIVDGQTNYTWIDGMNTGFKTSASGEQQAGTTASNQEAIDADKKIDYRCESWSADQSFFTLPDIQFTDLSATVPQVPSGADMPAQGTPVPQDQKAMQCAACNSLPEGSRDQCLQALACEQTP